MAPSWGLHTLRGNISLFALIGASVMGSWGHGVMGSWGHGSQDLGKNAAAILLPKHIAAVINYSVSQRSLHNAPIFRLSLKVAVNGTHQCDFQNF
jgi:hypothetical protein